MDLHNSTRYIVILSQYLLICTVYQDIGMGLRNVTSGNWHGVRKYSLSSSYEVDMIKSENGLANGLA